MIHILPVCVLYTKIIHEESEENVTGGVFRQHRGMTHWFITKFLQMIFQAIVGNFSCLLQVRHYFVYLDIYPYLVLNDGHLILIHDFLQY